MQFPIHWRVLTLYQCADLACLLLIQHCSCFDLLGHSLSPSSVHLLILAPMRNTAEGDRLDTEVLIGEQEAAIQDLLSRGAFPKNPQQLMALLSGALQLKLGDASQTSCQFIQLPD